MRQSYLESYYNLIPSSQQNRLLQVLKSVNDAAGISSDAATLEKQLAEALLNNDAGRVATINQQLFELRQKIADLD
jgi:hypothetical protein